MTEETMPARTITDPKDGSKWYSMHTIYAPLPDDMPEADRVIAEAQMRAQAQQDFANRQAFKQHLKDIGYEGAKDGFWYWFSRELKYGWRFGYRVYKALGGVH